MVDVLIVNWNSGDALNKCIHSIMSSDNLKYVDKIIISDNYSSDNSLQDIPVNDKITLLSHKKNHGFAAALNLAIKQSKSDYILILNPDTQLLEGNLKRCLAFAKANNDLHVLGCQLINESGEITVSCSRFPQVKSFFIQSLGLHKLPTRLFKAPILMTDFDHASNRKVDQVMGAFMFMHKSVVSTVGSFDERFFVYYEDLDFSLRLSKLGGSSYFNADIRAIHSGMGSTKAIPALRLFYNLKSRHQYAKKHFSAMGYIFVKLTTYTVEFIVRLLYYLFKGNITEVKHLFKAYKMMLF